MADARSLQVRLASAQGESVRRVIMAEVDILTGPFLWFTLRKIMHDAVCSYFSDTRPYSPSSRLCRSQIQFLRGELRDAHVAQILESCIL